MEKNYCIFGRKGAIRCPFPCGNYGPSMVLKYRVLLRNSGRSAGGTRTEALDTQKPPDFARVGSPLTFEDTSLQMKPNTVPANNESSDRFRHIPWQLNPHRFLTSSEVKQLRSSTRHRAFNCRVWNRARMHEWLIVELGLHTGLRVFEMIKLNCGDLALDAEFSSVIVHRGKGGRARVVRIAPSFIESLKFFLFWKKANGERVGSADPLLVGRRARRMAKRTAQAIVSRAYEAAGIHGHRTHDLRHTYASHLYRASRSNLRLVQKETTRARNYPNHRGVCRCP